MICTPASAPPPVTGAAGCTMPAGSSCPGTVTPAATPLTCARKLAIADLKCCFPNELNYTVRTGTQWMVFGDGSGFIHHVVADEASNGACRNSCDPAAVRKNARVLESSLKPGIVPDRGPNDLEPSTQFMNPMFRFAISKGSVCLTDADCNAGDGCNQGVCNHKDIDLADMCSQTKPCPNPSHQTCDDKAGRCIWTCANNQACPTGDLCDANLDCYAFSGKPVAAITPRDSVFRFSTTGSFSGMLIPLTSDPSTLVNPQRVTYLAPTSEVVITDGTVYGVIFVSLDSASVSRSYF
jgi:hypothetical protein